MYKSKKVLMFLAVLIFSASSLFAQGLSDNADAVVKIDIKKSLSINLLNPEGLYFEDVIVGTGGSATKDPVNGARFKVDGNNTGAVSITFVNATLSDGGSNTLIFAPSVESTKGDPTYSDASTVLNNGSENMTDAGGGSGELYLWVGGSIDLSSAVQGDYTGTFTMTVAY